MKKHAFYEATLDTVIAMMINIPLNYLLVSLAFRYSWTPLTTTLVLTTFFTALGITRKTIVRLHYQKRLNNA